MSKAAPCLRSRCVAEVLGTFVLVFFGCGSVHAAVLMGAQSGVWQVAIVWGVAIAVACFLFGGISGAHINPAVTLSMALWRDFPPADVVPYVVSQLAGAALAAATLFFLYGPYLDAREADLGVERGQPGSEMTAMCYGEYYPNPGGLAAAWEKARAQSPAPLDAVRKEHYARFPAGPAFVAECLGTLLLALVVFALTDTRNAAAPLGRLAPVFIGLTVAILISVLAPLTQACFNPARDFGPRFVAYLAGWGPVAFPGPNGWGCLVVYLAAPLVGAAAGGGLYEWVVRPSLPGPDLEPHLEEPAATVNPDKR
jgi:glycerol uptake facilitator protein